MKLITIFDEKRKNMLNKSEQATIETLSNVVNQIQAGNDAFKKQVIDQLESVQRKQVPVNLEKDILSSVQLAVNEAILKSLTSYDSPIVKLVKLVVESRTTELRTIITGAFDQVIATDAFRQSIVDAFSHKVARTIISNNDGLFDKVSNDLKQDSVFKAKMQLAVAKVVDEVLVARKELK